MNWKQQMILPLIAAGALCASGHAAPVNPGGGITASFGGGRLTIHGDNYDNVIIVSRTPEGMILVNEGDVQIRGRTPNVSETMLITVQGLMGNDEIRLDESNGPLPKVQLLGQTGNDILAGGAGDDELDGGPGDDTLYGAAGLDALMGGDGNDTLYGGPGEDSQFGGFGHDNFIVLPGDGTDQVVGDEGNDALIFNGSDENEILTLSPSGTDLFFARNIGPVFMICTGIELVELHAAGGADKVTVHPLAATEVQQVNVNLNLALDLGMGDTQSDTVAVHGTESDDVFGAAGSATGLEVFGVSALITIVGGESLTDRLILRGLDGDDVLDATSVEMGAMALTLDGGPGHDVLLGGDGDDTLLGGFGDDVLFGGLGLDIVDGGPGDDFEQD